MKVQLGRFGPRRHFALGAIVFAAAPLVGAQTPAGSADSRPTVALAEFTNGALGRTSEFAELSTGIQDIMIATLAGSPSVRVVERRKLQNILDEQKLASSSEIDQSTAIRVGRILGAQHFVAGGVIIFRGDVRIDVRAFNTETSRVEYTETIQGKDSELLELIDRVSKKVALGLKLPPVPAQSSSAKPPKSDQAKAVALLGRALIARDKGDKQSMLAAANEALALYPGFAPARTLVDGAASVP